MLGSLSGRAGSDQALPSLADAPGRAPSPLHAQVSGTTKSTLKGSCETEGRYTPNPQATIQEEGLSMRQGLRGVQGVCCSLRKVASAGNPAGKASYLGQIRVQEHLSPLQEYKPGGAPRSQGLTAAESTGSQTLLRIRNPWEGGF